MFPHVNVWGYINGIEHFNEVEVLAALLKDRALRDQQYLERKRKHDQDLRCPSGIIGIERKKTELIQTFVPTYSYTIKLLPEVIVREGDPDSEIVIDGLTYRHIKYLSERPNGLFNTISDHVYKQIDLDVEQWIVVRFPNISNDAWCYWRKQSPLIHYGSGSSVILNQLSSQFSSVEEGLSSIRYGTRFERII